MAQATHEAILSDQATAALAVAREEVRRQAQEDPEAQAAELTLMRLADGQAR